MAEQGKEPKFLIYYYLSCSALKKSIFKDV